jgi:hypothetical protein
MMRVSDEDRHKVAEVLRTAAGEGRIDLEELDERLEATYASKTYADLVPLTADLPVAGLGPHGLAARPAGSGSPAHRPSYDPSVPVASYSSSISVLGDCSRRGVWELPEQHTAFSLMGGVTLDLRQARFAAREVTIDAYAIMAGIDIIVNPWTRVVVEGFGVMGDFSEARSKVVAEITPDSPVVRVRGLSLMAGVSVKRKAMPGESRKRLGRKP